MPEPTDYPPKRQCRMLCVPFTEESYLRVIAHAPSFRRVLNKQIERHPELFPKAIEQGYRMKDSFVSARLGLRIRRIEVAGVSYTVHPSFVMPYLVGLSEQVEGPLFLRKFTVPFWALARVFGRNPMYWYRLEQSLGRHQLVGTTVRQPGNLPEDVVGDEKHTRIQGEKVFVATTCAQGCVLGVSVAENAGEEALTQAYGVFKKEAQQLEPTYNPKTVNTDGWPATQGAWRGLFPTIVLISCFLHVYIRLRDRSKKKFKTLFADLADRLWNCYRATTQASFSQRLRRLQEWAQRSEDLPAFMREKIDKLRANAASFTAAYAFPEAYRTSNLLDRLMQRMDRHLFNTQYFHGSRAAAEYSIRAWALIHNFAPSNPYTVRQHRGFQSPAERLNQFRYHENWLQNLLISGSLRGGFSPPLNP